MILSEQDVRTLKGLCEVEAAQILEQEGFNELPFTKSRNFFRVALDVFSEPMFLLLVACGSIYLLLGDLRESL
ncbi:MAG: cation-transporting P-type ATPase, partial [Candidatus Margulisiibacteriota bacterium]